MSLLALGASYEAFMAAGDADRYPARGQLVESWSTAVVITSIGITRHSWWTPFARLPRPRVGDQQLGAVVGMDHGARSARYC